MEGQTDNGEVIPICCLLQSLAKEVRTSFVMDRHTDDGEVIPIMSSATK